MNSDFQVGAYCNTPLPGNQNSYRVTIEGFPVTSGSHMKNELFPFWAGGWKAYAEEEKKHVKVVVPASFFDRLLKIGRAIFTPTHKEIDKRLF